MKNILLIIAAVVIALGIQNYVLPKSGPETAAKTETTYERVVRTRTLRCGYNIWEPWIVQDSKTGKLSGPYVEFMEELTRNANLKLEWTAQLGWGTFPEDLKTGKVDAMCAGVWPDAKRGVVVAWTVPAWYNVLNAYVRSDYPKFPNDKDDLNRLNAKDITIAVLDDTTPEQIAKEYYPNAERYSLPGLSTESDLLLAVTTRKASVVFADEAAVKAFRQGNSETNLRRYASKTNVAVYPQVIGINIHELELQNVLNTATTELINLGVVGRIIHKYNIEDLVSNSTGAP